MSHFKMKFNFSENNYNSISLEGIIGFTWQVEIQLFSSTAMYNMVENKIKDEKQKSFFSYFQLNQNIPVYHTDYQ